MAIGVAAAALLMAPAVAAVDAALPATRTAAGVGAQALPQLSAAEIVARHVVARGGAQAWKAVQTLQLSGRIEAGRGDSIARAEKIINAGRRVGGKASNAELVAANADPAAARQIQLPFTLDLQRPNRMRLEVGFDGKTAVQVFDGEHGWKYRPFLNRSDAEPFSADELRTEASRGDLDGLLINHAAKGSKVELEGGDAVEGKPAYRLKVTLRSGSVQHVWVDARSFLDVKVEGFPRRMDGKMHPVYVYQRDFRAVQGVIIPFVLETAVDGYSETHRIQIETGAVNPKLDAALFSKPGA
ncbi:MAG: outer membrane lipoprotein-sorting protein [Pseudomonadota bacterium]|nr:outer membrane lipoprotein-sorting protein [Pseudomonadota bacterium]